MKILVADDDLTSRRMLASIIQKWGFVPVMADHGIAAWDELQKPDSPRLVLLDWNMPGMDGLEVCRRARSQDISNPPYIIIITGRGDKDDVVIGLDAGANDYISKPYDNNELRARIQVGKRMLELQAVLLEMRDAMSFQASHDSLTGLLNRRAILERFAKELSRAHRENSHLRVAMVDIDHFKRINDTFGHQTGDIVLTAVAKCLRGNLRDYDCAGRYGGEEFLVLVPGANPPGQDDLFERLRGCVSTLVVACPEGPISVTVSIGVALDSGQDRLDELLSRADQALYRAKGEGRNRVVAE